MNDEAYRKRIERYRPRLEAELKELEAMREQTVQDREPVQLDQQSVGRLSRMDAMQAQQMAMAAERRRQVQIARIHRALQQMETEDYGFCVTCGREIPDGRLDADPAAHLCVACAGANAP